MSNFSTDLKKWMIRVAAIKKAIIGEDKTDECCLDSNGNFVGWWEHGNFKTEGLDSEIQDV